MSQQFEFGDWVEYMEEQEGPWKEGRYVTHDGTTVSPILIENTNAHKGHDWCPVEWVRPHPTKKRDAFATLTVQNPSPNVLTAIVLDHAKAIIELAIKANNGGFNA